MEEINYPNKLPRAQIGLTMLGLRTYVDAQGISTMTTGERFPGFVSTTSWGHEELVVDYGSQTSRNGPLLKVSIRPGERQAEITGKVINLLGAQGLATLVEGNPVFQPEPGTTMFIIETI